MKNFFKKLFNVNKSVIIILFIIDVIIIFVNQIIINIFVI